LDAFSKDKKQKKKVDKIEKLKYQPAFRDKLLEAYYERAKKRFMLSVLQSMSDAKGAKMSMKAMSIRD
jgi:hypothetical protein